MTMGKKALKKEVEELREDMVELLIELGEAKVYILHAGLDYNPIISEYEEAKLAWLDEKKGLMDYIDRLSDAVIGASLERLT